VDLLDNPVHRDAWGSPTAIPEILGAAPDGQPQSELWMGAHPSSPSLLVRGGAPRSLADVISADPGREVGDAVVGSYGPRLPFLLKVLAAARPLSLQAHPSPTQAAAGFADEEQRGIPLDHPGRNYADAYHKPEMICALTEFHALCGFRRVDETVALIERLDVAALATDVETLRAPRPGSSRLRTVLIRLLHLPTAERGPLVDAVAGRCAELASTGDPDAQLAQTVVELADLHPGDMGVVCALFMNRVRLEPGEAIFLGAGNLHAYLRGVGVEIMASSDNVLRGGLTGRHIDVDELLAILDTTPGPVPLVTPVVRNDVEVDYPVPVPDFRLSQLTLRAGSSYRTEPGLPRILLVVGGAVSVADAGQAGSATELTRGQAAFLPAGGPSAVLSGPATAFLASTSAPATGVTPGTSAAG